MQWQRLAVRGKPKKKCQGKSSQRTGRYRLTIQAVLLFYQKDNEALPRIQRNKIRAILTNN